VRAGHGDRLGAAPAIAQESPKDKAEVAWDKTKSKTQEMTGKAKDKLLGAKESASIDEIRSAQQALKDKGLNPGPIDGRMGSQTKAALKEFQQKDNLTLTGSLDAETRDRLLASSPPSASPGTEPSRTRTPSR
jgi:peptidoglycan hydrolase-like protein with peptidoglycan-binding domain